VTNPRRILALTFGDSAQASTFFRVLQYQQRFADGGIDLESTPARSFDDWNRVATYDTVLLQKTLLPAGKLRRLRQLSRRLVYDIDDAIWHPHGRNHFFLTNLRQNFRLRTILRSADLCVAANEVLATHLRRWTPRVQVVPMALDESQWAGHETKTREPRVRIGWSGNPVNFRYLEAIEAALLEIQSKFPNVEFAIFSGQQPDFRKLRFTHLPFMEGREPETIRTFDIGLLPLPDDPFAQGKSPIKGLQYMACGAAVVLSPVGAAAEMFRDGKTALFAGNHEGWVAALSRLVESGDLRSQLAARAREVFLSRHTTAASFPSLLAAISG
jgi:glycosyltransferase involved in cell wall biosynthesis